MSDEQAKANAAMAHSLALAFTLIELLALEIDDVCIRALAQQGGESAEAVSKLLQISRQPN